LFKSGKVDLTSQASISFPGAVQVVRDRVSAEQLEQLPGPDVHVFVVQREVVSISGLREQDPGAVP
jgi:hypothetical protein